MRSKFLLILSIIILLLSITSGGVYYYRKQFTYLSPKIGKIVEAIYSQGKVKTDKVFELKLGHMANIKRFYVSEGQKIDKNAPLLLTDSNVTFKAPFSGVITYLGPHANETIIPNTTLIKLENTLELYIEVSLEQKGALRVRPEQKAMIIFESLRGEKYQGFVHSIYSREDEFIAKIKVDNLRPNILPGMTADVAIIAGEKEKALLIPLSSILNGMVTLKRENEAKKVKIPVKIGTIDGSWAEVLEGDIKLSDQLLVKKGNM